MELKIYNEQTSFKAWAEKWLNHKTIGISMGYKTAVTCQVKHLISFFGDTPINVIKPMYLDELIENLAINNPNTNKPASKKLLKEIRNTAIHIFEYASENSDYDRNPALKLKIPKNAPKSTRRPLTDEEIKWIVNMEHRARIPALIMIFCGLRSGEIIPLQWTDIDFDMAILPVCKSTNRISANKYEVKQGTKNGNSRLLPIPDDLLNELKIAKIKSTSRYICSKADGTMHTPTSWNKLWETFNNNLSHKYATIEQSKTSIYNPSGIKKRVDKITPHMFRHTYATLLYCSGVDVLTAQKLLGHSDVSTTLSIYTHLQQMSIDISIEKFDTYITTFFNK